VIKTIELAAEIAAERLNLEPEPWIAVEEAADNLDCPRSRIDGRAPARLSEVPEVNGREAVLA
jgi:hypothetical protein